MDGFEARALLFLFPRSKVSRQKARGCRATAAVTRQHENSSSLAERLRPRLKRHDRAKGDYGEGYVCEVQALSVGRLPCHNRRRPKQAGVGSSGLCPPWTSCVDEHDQWPVTAQVRHPPVAAIIVRPSRDRALPPSSCRAGRLVCCAYVQVHRYMSSTD